MEPRRADIDCLRVLAVLLVFVTYAAQVFNPIDEWHTENPESSSALGQPTVFMGPWLMSRFLMLAGTGAWFAFGSRDSTRFRSASPTPITRWERPAPCIGWPPAARSTATDRGRLSAGRPGSCRGRSSMMTRPRRKRCVGSRAMRCGRFLVAADWTRFAALKKKVGKNADAAFEMEDTRIKLDKLEREVPPSASLILDDVTPEKSAVEMHEQGGRGAICSAAGDVLRIFAGRYGNGDPRADLLKKAINGEATKVSRIGGETVWLRRPILTVGLMFQPSVLGSLDNRESLEGEGVFVR
jgi:hypothetical protein